MNERIKQLAEQAWDYVDNHCPYASEEQEMFQQKFAELIIADTLKVATLNMGYTEHQHVKALVSGHFG